MSTQSSTMSNTVNTIKEFNNYLLYCTRIAAFKSDSDYIPLLTVFILDKSSTLNETISKHLKDEVIVTAKAIKTESIKANFLSYFDYLKNSQNHIGFASGQDMYNLIKEEGEEFMALAYKLEWKELYSDTSLSYSTIGNVYIAQVLDKYILLDFGYSD
jgi:hypothetical protein